MDLTQSAMAILPDAPRVVHSSAQAWTAQRRLLVGALLLGAIAAVGLAATGGARSAAAFARTSPARRVAAALTSSSARAPFCSTENPSVAARDNAAKLSNAEHNEESSARAAGVSPTLEASAGPPTPPPRGRPAPSVAAQPGKDYGI
ncbi:MAG: hypothetical protein WDO74_19240 [Pseudomonadota bacterium]